MCNFNQQNEDFKKFISLFMQKVSKEVGGTNFLLGLIETLRETKPHPLTKSKCIITSEHIKIEWNKIIFKDKLEVLQEILLLHKSSQGSEFNILDIENQKKKKRILNVIKALIPVVFIVKPKNLEDGEGFEFTIFKTIDFDKNIVKFNPVFIAMFFCSSEYTKRALKYEVL